MEVVNRHQDFDWASHDCGRHHSDTGRGEVRSEPCPASPNKQLREAQDVSIGGTVDVWWLKSQTPHFCVAFRLMSFAPHWRCICSGPRCIGDQIVTRVASALMAKSRTSARTSPMHVHLCHSIGCLLMLIASLSAVQIHSASAGPVSSHVLVLIIVLFCTYSTSMVAEPRFCDFVVTGLRPIPLHPP